MKVIATTAALAFLTAALGGSFSSDAYAQAGTIMKGIDTTYRSGAAKTCSEAAQRCKKGFPSSAAACMSAGASCKQTGVFTNPQGKSFSGMTKQ